MRRVKDDYRNRLGEKSLENLMRITTEGCDIDDFDPKPATARFSSKRRHPFVQPYGERSSSDSTEAVLEKKNSRQELK